MDTISRSRLLAPNAVTAANIVAGFLSMLAAARGAWEEAVYLLFLAVLLDMLDGRVARWLGATSEFGREMDSLSDALSFGAAPAFLAYHALLAPLGPMGAAVAVLYLLAGVYRLARFNLTTDAHAKARHTLGVPTPVATGYVMVLVLMRSQVTAPVALVVVAVLALLMVSRFPLPEWGRRGFVSFALAVGVLNYIAVVIRPNWYTVGWWNLWNVVILLAGRVTDRRLREAGSTP